MKIYVDGHCDTLTCAYDERLKISDEKYCFNTKDAERISLEINNIYDLDDNKGKYLERAMVIQLLATFVNPKYEDGFKRANEVIDYYLENKGKEAIIKSYKDLTEAIKNKKLGVILTIENGKAIENNIDNINVLYEKGIRVMSVNWNEDNLLGTGALTTKDTGLTNLGIEYVKKLEEKGIIIDVSHSSEKTFWDVISNTNRTIVATHSCCYGICNHPRNLKDNQIKEIVKRDGIIGICLCNTFLNSTGKASVIDIEKHIRYIINLVGEDYVGIGTDFDGVEEENKLLDITRLSDIHILINYLRNKRYSEETINKIMGENWLRILKRNLK